MTAEAQSLEEQILLLDGPILIFGANGFIGSNVYYTLKKYRSDVHPVVSKDRSWRLDAADPASIVACDLNNAADVRATFKKYEPGTIFYLASFGAYSCQTTIRKIYQTNFLSLANTLEIAKDYQVRAFVHAGSSSEYGKNSDSPDEDDGFEPNSHYSVSKAAASLLIRHAGKFQNFPIMNLRLYSVYGPLEDSNRLIPQLVLAGQNQGFPPLVGPDIARDYIYVADVIEAFIKGANVLKQSEDFYGLSLNIGTGKQTTIRELTAVSKKHFQLTEEPLYGSYAERAWDLKAWRANIERARKILKWEPKTKIEEGIRKVDDWLASIADKDNYINRGTIFNNENLNGSKTIAAIVAIYKDAPSIPYMHQRLTDVLTSLNLDFQIIFVNDCSPDNAGQIIEEISKNDPNVIGINHSRNFGSQMAFVSGMTYADTDACVLLDGDLQDPPEVIPALVQKWEEGYEVVYGVRTKREMNRFVEILFKLFYIIFQKLTDFHVPRDAGDFSVIDRRAYKLIAASTERDLFLRGLRSYVGFKQVGVEYFRPEREFGKSTNNFIKNFNWAKKAIFSYSIWPINAMTMISVLMVIGSFLLISYVVYSAVFNNAAPDGIPTVIILLAVFSTILMVGVAIIGEYIGKILTEVKARPRYIRTSIVRNGKLEKIENSFGEE